MKVQSSHDCKGVRMPFVKCAFLTIALFALITSCKKEIAPSEEALIATEESSAALSAMSASNAVAAGTDWGALIADGEIPDKMNVMDMLGVGTVRYAIILESHISEDKGYERWRDAGYKILCNLNWGHVTNNKGNKKPVPFPTDLKEYRIELTAILDKYHPEVAVIENEETTDVFHSGPIEDYIEQLKVAVDVCKARGIKVADGGLNLELCQQVMNGTGRGTNYEETKKLIEAFKTIDLDFVNIHTKAPFSNQRNGNIFQPGAAEAVADFLRQETGKQVMCNEYNNENTSTSLISSATQAFENGGYRYFVPRSDNTGNGSYPLANETGTKLTSLGVSYKEAIR